MTTSGTPTTTRASVRRLMPIVLAVLIPGTANGQASDSQTRPVSVRETYEQHDKAASAARKAGDWATVRRHAAAVDTLFNGNPAALMSTARAHARLGEHTAALNLVRTVLSMGIVRNVADDPDLAALRSSPEWIELLSLNKSNGRAIGSPRTVFSIPDPAFLAEDVAWDGVRGRYLVSSVRKGIVAVAGRDGTLSPFITREARLWGAFAVAIDSARSKLWVTTVALPHFEGYVAADSGKAAVVRFDLATGALEKRYEMRRTSRGNSPGDAAVAPNGDLYIFG